MVFGRLFGTRKSLTERHLERQMERDARLDPHHRDDEIADIEHQLSEIPDARERAQRTILSAENLEAEYRFLQTREDGLRRRLENLQRLKAKGQ